MVSWSALRRGLVCSVCALATLPPPSSCFLAAGGGGSVGLLIRKGLGGAAEACAGRRGLARSRGGDGREGKGLGSVRAALLVPAETAEAEIKVKNSRFIGTVGHAPTIERAREFIQEVKDKYPDGRHHCYAFAVGHGASVTHGMGDDGEPSGTAGRPMLAVLTGTELGDACVVVTRYFGGTKLGTGGLVKAYTEATQMALLDLKCEEKVDRVTVKVTSLGYDVWAKARGPLEALGCEVRGEEFGEGVDVELLLEDTRLERVTAVLRDASSGRAEVSEPIPEGA